MTAVVVRVDAELICDWQAVASTPRAVAGELDGAVSSWLVELDTDTPPGGGDVARLADVAALAWLALDKPAGQTPLQRGWLVCALLRAWTRLYGLVLVIGEPGAGPFPLVLAGPLHSPPWVELDGTADDGEPSSPAANVEPHSPGRGGAPPPPPHLPCPDRPTPVSAGAATLPPPPPPGQLRWGLRLDSNGRPFYFDADDRPVYLD